MFRGRRYRYTGVLHERATRAELERTSLRLRLTGVALSATLLILGSDTERQPAITVVVLYLAAAVLQRYAAPRFQLPQVPIAGIVLDVAYAAAFVSMRPGTEPAWALFAIGIANAALRFGAWGAVAATAGAIGTYDAVLASRSFDLRASDLWPVQVLLAIGLICTELVFVTSRIVRERTELRSSLLAQRDVATAWSAEELCSRLVAHAVMTVCAAGAWIRVANGQRVTTTHQRGLGGGSGRHELEVPLDARSMFVATFVDADEHAQSFVRDLADDARATLAVLNERAEQRRTIDLFTRVSEALRAIATESDSAGVMAHLVMSADALGGAATLLRRIDGAIVAGATLGPDLVAAVRETRPPILFRSKGADGAEHDIALVSAGAGLALVLVSGAAPVTQTHLRALETLGRAAGGSLARIGERDALTAERKELRVVADRLQGELREREETLASTMHELRTPLTSVTAYGQLIAKNLQSALQQLAQLERLIGDLRHDPSALALADVDLLVAAREAAQRQRLLNEAVVSASVEGSGPFRVNADAGRIGQVLDNLLGNAVKFSPKGTHIEIVVRRDESSVLLSVIDAGPGLAPADVERVFERYYRSGKTEADVPGLGIGLSVSRDIVMAHGGRIWAESEGPGQGATFTIALPVASPVRAIAQ